MLLKFLRKRKNMKRIMWALAILIIPAFVIWGAGTSMKDKQNKPDYAGKIFNKKISYDEYINMWNVTRDYALKTFGENFPRDFIDKMAWDRLILLKEAGRQNLKVKDSEVIEKIASFTVFQKNGSFDKKLYKSTMSDQARAFEEKMRDDILVGKLREKIISGVSVTEDELKNAYKETSEKIKISYISLPFSDFEKDINYKEDDLLKIYNSDKESFRKPEQVNVRYIQILFSDFKNDTVIRDDEIKKYFEEHLSDYKKPDSNEAPILDEPIKKNITEILSAIKIKSSAEERSYKVLDEAVSKNSLDKAAETFFLQVKETGFFSKEQAIPAIGWSYPFIKTSFELPAGTISKIPVALDNSFCIIQLKDRKKPYIPEFNEVKGLTAQAYINNTAISLAEKKAKEIFIDVNNEIKTGKTFEDAVKKYGLQVTQTDFLTNGEYIPELGPAKDIFKAAASINIGQITGPVKALKSWLILRPDSLQGVDETKFQAEKEKFKETVLSQKKEEVFSNWFQALKKKAGFVSFTSEE